MLRFNETEVPRDQRSMKGTNRVSRSHADIGVQYDQDFGHSRELSDSLLK